MTVNPKKWYNEFNTRWYKMDRCLKIRTEWKLVAFFYVVCTATDIKVAARHPMLPVQRLLLNGIHTHISWMQQYDENCECEGCVLTCIDLQSC